ncbi:MAG: lysophospholipid acyltransferase family protein [bacterium]|nr:lysophospholipid acyltransferase family protein [bacterium]
MFKQKILPVIAVWVIKFLSFTHKVIFINSEIVQEIKGQAKNIIFVFWHGKQFILVNSHAYRSICIMTSLSSDGDLQSKILKKLGYIIVRGSSSRGGAKALVKLIKKIYQGHDIAFAADGPHGPIYELKPGPIFLAAKTSAVILPVATGAKNKWILDNWDKYLIPKPFTKTYIKYGDPIIIPHDFNLDEEQVKLTKVLNILKTELEEEIKKEENTS